MGHLPLFWGSGNILNISVLVYLFGWVPGRIFYIRTLILAVGRGGVKIYLIEEVVFFKFQVHYFIGLLPFLEYDNISESD